MKRLSKIFLNEDVAPTRDVVVQTANGPQVEKSKDTNLSTSVDSDTPVTKFKKPIQVARAIVALSGGRFRLSGKKRKSYRVQRTNPKVEVPAEEITKILESIGAKVIGIIPPGGAGSDSSKFNTFLLQLGEMEVSIIFGQGSNRGHDFETETIEKLRASQEAAKKKQARGELHKILLDAFGINPEDIEKITHVGGKRVKRPIEAGPKDVGAMISDLDFELQDGSKIHVSLKNREGKTFANSGYFSAFEPMMVKNKAGREVIVFATGKHILDEFVVQGCGVDKEKVVSGLNDYVHHTVTDPPYRNVRAQFDASIIKSYLASAYGYGYWYLRPKMISQGPGYRLIHLASAEDAMSKVGEITSVTINYPYWTPKSSSKQVTVKIFTSTAYYNVEIRNSQGKVHPNEIKVRLMKMFD